ncbi:MAG: hypothetical protein AVDCRST_MAG17-1485 [uncultured Solirubrobacterales bacterium]|uniref:Uncharacterized protein n=1 Tax=uncultured Solirubrobacterales bacterium TaxID=768556 RepID=A0A6J4SLW9_9ACTN|nr:MAG: hypothetical protein AVDCRST_MAG17-1485 [uncultured Solirubrobacterales bacterium]
MVVLWAILVGSVIWIASWSLGIKAFDAFLVLMAVVVAAVAFRAVKPFLDQHLGRP